MSKAHEDAEYLRAIATHVMLYDEPEVVESRKKLMAIADSLEWHSNALMEIRGLIRPVIMNAPEILSQATIPKEEL